MTQKQNDKDYILNLINRALVTSEFDNVARKQMVMLWAYESGEKYGSGSPRFNQAIKQLIAEGLVVSKKIGGETKYAIAA